MNEPVLLNAGWPRKAWPVVDVTSENISFQSAAAEVELELLLFRLECSGRSPAPIKLGPDVIPFS